MLQRTAKYLVVFAALTLWALVSHNIIISHHYIPDDAARENIFISGNGDSDSQLIREAYSLFLASPSPNIGAGTNNHYNYSPDHNNFSGGHHAKPNSGITIAHNRTSFNNSLSGYSSRPIVASGRAADYYILALRQLII